MLSRFLEPLRARGARHAGTSAAAPIAVAPIAVAPIALTPIAVAPVAEAPARAAGDGALPTAAELLEGWREAVGRVSLELRARYEIDDAPRSYAEALLVRLAVDLDVVIRQPSQAAQEAFAVAGDASCELPALVRVVERDPVLVRGLLRHAASALHGGYGVPASVDDAVRRLGAKGVQVAVLAGMAEALLARPASQRDAVAPHVWAHMVRTGPRARALARAVGVPPHEAFTLGLLHDVGKLVLLDIAATLREELGPDARLPDGLAAEALSRLHEPLGGIALLRWGVEPGAARAVATHHRAPPPAYRDRRSEVVYLAERLDVAVTAGRPVALDEWFAEGGLTAPRRDVERALAAAVAAGG